MSQNVDFIVFKDSFGSYNAANTEYQGSLDAQVLSYCTANTEYQIRLHPQVLGGVTVQPTLSTKVDCIHCT